MQRETVVLSRPQKLIIIDDSYLLWTRLGGEQSCMTAKWARTSLDSSQQLCIKNLHR